MDFKHSEDGGKPKKGRLTLTRFDERLIGPIRGSETYQEHAQVSNK